MQQKQSNKSYHVDVRTDSDYDDIPTTAVFSIDETTASEILKLAALVKQHGLHKVEKFDYRTTFLKQDLDDEEGDVKDESPTDADCLCVSETEFWFTAYLKHTSVEVLTERQDIAELVAHFGLNGDQHENPPATASVPQEVFAGHLSFDGVMIAVEFQAPVGATQAEKDAAYLGALAQKAEVNYLAVGSIAG